MSKKLTIEFIRLEFKNENYVLLSDEYKNNLSVLDYICPKGHKHSTSWNNWNKDNRCPYCAGNGKPSIKNIKIEFGKEGYRLLSNKYLNARSKLNYICPNDHRHSISWDNWKHGYRCPYCNGRPIITIEQINEFFKKEGYILLTKQYRNNKQKLNCICLNGHKCNITWKTWFLEHRCLTCYKLGRFGSGHPNWKGGISCEPYCDIWLDKDFKESIKQRDGCKCRNPDCWGTSTKLCIHHINYNKKDCSPNNLITLCVSCNSTANKDREWHTAWYQVIMYMRYGYKY